MRTLDPSALINQLIVSGPVCNLAGVTSGQSSKLAPMSQRHKDALEKAGTGIGLKKSTETRTVRITHSIFWLDLLVQDSFHAVKLQDGSIYGDLTFNRQKIRFHMLFAANKRILQIHMHRVRNTTTQNDSVVAMALASAWAVDTDAETRTIFDAVMQTVAQMKLSAAPSNPVNLADLCYQFCDAVTYYLKENPCQYEIYATDTFLQMPLMAVKTGNAIPIPGMQPPKEFQTETQNDRNRRTREKRMNETPEKAAPAATTEDTNAMRPYREGQHIIPYHWNEKQRARIVSPEFLDNFVPIPEFFRLMQKLDFRLKQRTLPLLEMGMTDPVYTRGNAVNVLLYGNPGTGKTVLAHALSAATGLPLYETKFDKYTESDEIEGKNKIVEGKLAFAETDFLEGYESGGIILMEEINCADQNMLTGTLNNAIEYPSFIMKNGYQKIERNPMTVIIATMNVGTEGTMWLNQAFASRFKQKYRISDPTPEDFIRFLTSYGYAEYNAKYIYEAYTKIRNSLLESRSTSEYVLNLSTRACLGALENMEEGDDPKTAITDTLIGAIGIVDPKTAESLEKNVVANLPNYRSPKRKG